MAVKMPLKSLPAEKPSALILDDEDKICKIIQQFLVISGIFKNVVVANSVSIALMKIQNEQFDLIIVDYNLPDKKGTEFIDIIRNSKGYSKVKFLLISGFLDNRTLADVMSAGVKNVLVKPFTRLMLIKKVCEIMREPNPYDTQDGLRKKK